MNSPQLGASRGNGILNNELYIGRLVWNRQRFIKDPSTGKRVSRRNPDAEWIRSEVPELRIVDGALWEAVKARQAELAKIFAATTIGVREARARRFNMARRRSFCSLVCSRAAAARVSTGSS